MLNLNPNPLWVQTGRQDLFRDCPLGKVLLRYRTTPGKGWVWGLQLPTAFPKILPYPHPFKTKWSAQVSVDRWLGEVEGTRSPPTIETTFGLFLNPYPLDFPTPQESDFPSEILQKICRKFAPNPQQIRGWATITFILEILSESGPGGLDARDLARAMQPRHGPRVIHNLASRLMALGVVQRTRRYATQRHAKGWIYSLSPRGKSGSPR